MGYEIILFDADETLFDFKKSERYALEKLICGIGIEYDECKHSKIYSKINKDVWSRLEQGTLTPDGLKIERASRLLAALEVEGDAKEVSERYLEHLSEASFLYKETIEVLSYLSKKYRLAIITNGLSAVQNKRIRQSEIAHFFECIIISEEIKVAKPNPEIFEYTLRELSHEDKSKVLMIGDNLKSDIKGGINFEIDTCWFNPDKAENEIKIVPTHEIQSLLQLKQLL